MRNSGVVPSPKCWKKGILDPLLYQENAVVKGKPRSWRLGINRGGSFGIFLSFVASKWRKVGWEGGEEAGGRAMLTLSGRIGHKPA